MKQNGNVSPAVALGELYPAAELAEQKVRYEKLLGRFHSMFGDTAARLFSVPGRSELCGNHTDHNHGCVLACSVDLDIIAAAAPSGDDRVVVASEGFEPDVVELNVTEPLPEERGRSVSLVRGVIARLREQGYQVEGFRATTASRVLKGSGLSSSAAYEVTVAQIISSLFNDGKIDALTMAKAAQYAERDYFGKPCGLMDQTACAEGGIVAIDFEDTDSPIVERIGFDFVKTGYWLCIVDTAGSHADLTEDYAAIQSEMRAVAQKLGHSVLRECDEQEFWAALPALREELGDRAVLRAIHFFSDNDRVARQVDALRKNDFSTFLSLVVESGRSSALQLQNSYSIKNPRQQGVPLALCLAQRLLSGSGAWRVHGGGFGGTIQAFVPERLLVPFAREMNRVFGPNATYQLSVRSIGPCEIAAQGAEPLRKER